QDREAAPLVVDHRPAMSRARPSRMLDRVPNALFQLPRVRKEAAPLKPSSPDEASEQQSRSPASVMDETMPATRSWPLVTGCNGFPGKRKSRSFLHLAPFTLLLLFLPLTWNRTVPSVRGYVCHASATTY